MHPGPFSDSSCSLSEFCVELLLVLEYHLSVQGCGNWVQTKTADLPAAVEEVLMPTAVAARGARGATKLARLTDAAMDPNAEPLLGQ